MVGMSHRVESEFVHYVVESLHSLGPVVAKRMFNGHGLFLNDVMFALVAWDTLYFKVDNENRPAFEEKGLEPYAYTDQRGRSIELPYCEAPPEGLDDPDLLGAWGRKAIAAACRAAQAEPSATGAQKRRA